MSRADDLERIISHLDTLYEVGEDCVHPDTDVIVTDGEYDAMRRELAKLRPDSKIFDTPSASNNVSGINKIKHDPPLTSISKASHEDRAEQESQLFKWMKDCIDAADAKTKSGPKFDLAAKTIDGVAHKERCYNGEVVSYPRNYFYQTYKLDGVSCALYYVKGELVAAGSRPSKGGLEGEDITENVKYVSGIPQKLKKPLTCSIRGELICKLSDFEKVQAELAAAGEKLRANPRNHTAGGVRQFKDPTLTKDARISFVGISIESLDSPPYKTEIERAIWANKELGIQFVQIRPFNFYDLQVLEDNVPNLDYEVDGIVIGVNNLEDQEQLGRHGDRPTGNPKGKIAWKFAEQRAHPPLKVKEWKTGRTGAIKPVGCFDAVALAGTQVGRATLHNVGFIFRNQIKIGTVLEVLKAGKIIPKVVGTISNTANYKTIEDVDYPRACPSCGCKTVVEQSKSGGDDMYELVCPNKDACPSQNISGLEHFLKTFGVLGLGESKVTALVEGGAVKTPADFYKLDVLEVIACGLSERQALLALAGIHMVSAPDKLDDDELKKVVAKAKKVKKNIPLWKLFASFGIESAGKSAGKALVDHFNTFDAIRSASVTALESVSDVGSKTAEIVHDYFRKHEAWIDELLKHVEPELPKIGPQTGKTFVFTGGFAEGKKYWELQVEAQGGKCSGSVGKSTNYVVEGTDAGSKAQKAKDLGIPLISVADLKKILNLP